MQQRTICLADSHIPAEIFHAAGLATVRLTDLVDDAAAGPQYLPAQSCAFCRSAERTAGFLKDRVSGIVFASSCTAMEKLYEIFLRKSGLGFVAMVDLPKGRDAAAAAFYAQRLAALLSRLERHFGAAADAASLARAFKLNNGLRRALTERGAYASYLFKGRPLSLGNLEACIGEAELWWEPDCGLPRLMVVASRLQEDAVREAILEEGGNVVLFASDEGHSLNAVQVPQGGTHPLLDLAGAYLSGRDGARSICGLPEVSLFSRLIRERRVDAVVTLSYPFCARTGYDAAWVRRQRRELQVPVLDVQTDAVGSLSAGARSRIAALLEMAAHTKGTCR